MDVPLPLLAYPLRKPDRPSWFLRRGDARESAVDIMTRPQDSPISVPDLRAERQRAEREGYKTSLVAHDALDALLEIAEAARDYFAQSLRYSNDADADLAQENLRDALRRVDDGRYA